MRFQGPKHLFAFNSMSHIVHRRIKNMTEIGKLIASWVAEYMRESAGGQGSTLRWQRGQKCISRSMRDMS
jgi:hypothetical protein